MPHSITYGLANAALITIRSWRIDDRITPMMMRFSTAARR